VGEEVGGEVVEGDFESVAAGVGGEVVEENVEGGVADEGVAVGGTVGLGD